MVRYSSEIESNKDCGMCKFAPKCNGEYRSKGCDGEGKIQGKNHQIIFVIINVNIVALSRWYSNNSIIFLVAYQSIQTMSIISSCGLRVS